MLLSARLVIRRAVMTSVEARSPADADVASEVAPAAAALAVTSCVNWAPKSPDRLPASALMPGGGRKGGATVR